MATQKWILGFGVLMVLHFHVTSARAQIPPLLPPSSPANNPIDPASLNADPAFGDSGPVMKEFDADRKEDALRKEGTTWIPRLRVVLVTALSQVTEVTAYPMPSRETFFSPSESAKQVVRKTTHTINQPSQKSIVLECDDVNVEAAAGENDELTYSFSCKGKAMLTFNGYTVTGDSINSIDGKLSIRNAVIKSDQVTMTSETLILQLPIRGVQVGATNPSDFLKPMPDVIGGASNRDEAADTLPTPFPSTDEPFQRLGVN